MHQRLHHLSERERRKKHLSKVQCFSIQKGWKNETPQKVVWYFPLTARLQRYFVDRKEAELMRWHKEREKPGDGDEPKLRHPADASQWRALKGQDADFPADP